MSHTFWYSQTDKSLNLRREKVASQYGVNNAFLPETTTFKKRFPKLERKNNVSYNDSKTENMTTKICYLFTHFSEIEPFFGGWNNTMRLL